MGKRNIPFSSSVNMSDSVADIIEINRRSALTKKNIRIMELSSLSDIIPREVAEDIRKMLLKNNVQVKQLTNQRVFEPWTKVKGFVEKCMKVRYVPESVLPIHGCSEPQPWS